QIAAIDRTGTAAETDSSLDVAKIELGDPVGILTIPSISLKLPIYDGTSDKILENGVGITEGTGDITGGNGKNPLIAGHSGLYKDNLFDDLPSV
ncbi:sortase, partial [Enterococcus faecalis]